MKRKKNKILDENGEGIGDDEQFPDNRTEGGHRFLMGYRKFIVALIWTVLTCFSVVWVLVIIKPSASQGTIVIWLVSTAGFFCAFFVGGNVLVQMWLTKYGPPQTTAFLGHTTTQQQTEQVITVKYNPQEDSAWGKAFEGEEKDLPPAKPR